MTGMPTRAAPITFSASPSLKRKPRREEEELPPKSGHAHMGSTLLGSDWRRLRTPRDGTPLGDEPGHDVGDLLGGQWPPRRVAAPVGHAQIRPPEDDSRAQVLVAHESEVRGVPDGARFGPRLALRAMAVGAGGGVHGPPSSRVSGPRRIRWQVGRFGRLHPAPPLPPS